MSELTLPEAKEKVMKNEDSISQLITPSDLVHQEIDIWENANIDKLKEEIAASMGDAWVYGIDHPYGDMIRELAVNRYVEDMMRVPFDHLVFDSREKCVIEGYWLYNMSENEVRELVYENLEEIEFFYEYENEVMQQIESAILEARLSGIGE